VRTRRLRAEALDLVLLVGPKLPSNQNHLASLSSCPRRPGCACRCGRGTSGRG
jgi:hypothetical protein